MASVTNEHRALAAATLRYAATLLSEKEQPGSFWLNELAESFEWGCQDRWAEPLTVARSPGRLPSVARFSAVLRVVAPL